MIGTVDAGLPEAERFDEEPFFFFDLAHRQDGTMEAARGNLRVDLVGRPAGARVVRILDHFQQQAGRMREPDERLSEALQNPAVLDLVPVQMVLPEWQRAFRHRVGGGRDLARTRSTRDPPIRKRRQDQSDLGVRVAVVEVVVRVAAIEEDRLLDQPQAEHLRDEVDVLLRAVRAQRDVVQAFHEIRHVSSPAFLSRCCRAAP